MNSHDEAAFREFVTAQMDQLRGLAYLTCGDWQLAEDAVCTVLAKLYSRWRRVDRPDSYARTMVVRAAVDEVRRPWWRRERSAGDAMPESPVGDGTPGVIDRLTVLDALRALLPRRPQRPGDRRGAALPRGDGQDQHRARPGPAARPARRRRAAGHRHGAGTY